MGAKQWSGFHTQFTNGPRFTSRLSRCGRRLAAIPTIIFLTLALTVCGPGLGTGDDLGVFLLLQNPTESMSNDGAADPYPNPAMNPGEVHGSGESDPVYSVRGYTVGGTVNGLVGTGLVLQNNEEIDLAIESNGSFVFPEEVPSERAYHVTVKNQPENPPQSCYITNPSGKPQKKVNVTHVRVICPADEFTVGGRVRGLIGEGLIIQNNNGDDLHITANGDFTFETPLGHGEDYNVTVLAQPEGPDQYYRVWRGSGTIDSANVTEIKVRCWRRRR